MSGHFALNRHQTDPNWNPNSFKIIWKSRFQSRFHDTKEPVAALGGVCQARFRGDTGGGKRDATLHFITLAPWAIGFNSRFGGVVYVFLCNGTQKAGGMPCPGAEHRRARAERFLVPRVPRASGSLPHRSPSWFMYNSIGVYKGFQGQLLVFKGYIYISISLLSLLVLSREWMGMGEWDYY